MWTIFTKDDEIAFNLYGVGHDVATSVSYDSQDVAFLCTGLLCSTLINPVSVGHSNSLKPKLIFNPWQISSSKLV